MFDLYEVITNEVLDSLGKGIIPWRRPWTESLDGLSFNRITRKPYSLLNQILLSRNPGEYGTFKAWTAIGGKIKAGSKASKVFFWKLYEKEERDEKGEKVIKKIPVLRYYNVFHISQVENVYPLQPEEYETEPITEAEKVLNDYITREGIHFTAESSNEAYYSPQTDSIVVPEISQFKNSEEFYSTAFHECVHSTSKPERCNRETDNKNAFFGNEDYSREELVAELGAAFICARTGISNEKTLQNSESYIRSWMQALKNDKRMIVSAAGKAEKAANYILQAEPEES